MDAAPPERSPRVHRVRHLQDACRAAAPGAARTGRVRRRGPVGPVRRPVLGHRVREGCTRGDLRAGRRAVPAVGDFRRRAGGARGGSNRSPAPSPPNAVRVGGPHDDRAARRSDRPAGDRGTTRARSTSWWPHASSRTTAWPRSTSTTSRSGSGGTGSIRRSTRCWCSTARSSSRYAEIYRRRGEGDVRPSHRGRGIGAALLGWIERRAHASSRPPRWDSRRPTRTRRPASCSSRTATSRRGPRG